jgi:hypothetical protein
MDPTRSIHCGWRRKGRRMVAVACILVSFTGPAAFEALGSDRQEVVERAFSEEDPPSTCPNGYALRGVICSGSYCDNKRLICRRYTGTYDPTARYRWSRWFSDEGRNEEVSSSEAVSGIACSGRYCDNIQLRFLNTRQITNRGDCGWTRAFSEEQKRGECPDGKLVFGVRCKGRYCDNLYLYCCAAE